jgi:hypothetical protein
VEPHEVSAGVLGLVHRDIHGVKEVLHRRARRGVRRYAATEGATDHPALDNDHFELAPAAKVICERQPCGGIDAGQGDEELLPTPASHHGTDRCLVAHQLR